MKQLSLAPGRGTYSNLYERLVTNTHEPENCQACWPWAAARDRWGYGRLNVYVPGLGQAKKLSAHIALFVWLAAKCRNADDLFLAYMEHVCSGLELDHLCNEPSCIFPDHLELKTPSANCLRRRR